MRPTMGPPAREHHRAIGIELMILHRGDREPSKHKPYAIGWERDRRDVIASFDTLSDAISAIHNRTVRGLRLDRRYVVRYGGRIVWPKP
jgi:hypothetical protein